MTNFLLGIIAICFLALFTLIALLLIELKKTTVTLRNFANTTENSIKPVLEELLVILKNTKGISDNINDITSDVKQFSLSVNEIGQKIRTVSGMMDIFASSAVVKTMSLKAGINGAVSYLISNLLKKGGRK